MKQLTIASKGNAHYTHYSGALVFPATYTAKVKEKLGDGYILPSSIHELIFVPVDFSDDIESLRQMVTEINAGVVEEQDFLADDAWRVSEWT